MLNICSWLFSRFTCFDLRECVAARGQSARLPRRPLLQSASALALPLFRCIGSPPWYEIITQIHVEESNLILLIKRFVDHICYDNSSRMFQRTQPGSYYPCCQRLTLIKRILTNAYCGETLLLMLPAGRPLLLGNILLQFCGKERLIYSHKLCTVMCLFTSLPWLRQIAKLLTIAPSPTSSALGIWDS